MPTRAGLGRRIRGDADRPLRENGDAHIYPSTQVALRVPPTRRDAESAGADSVATAEGASTVNIHLHKHTHTHTHTLTHSLTDIIC
jgi:hypothetical protein